MSESRPAIILGRIESARKESPIAVFKCRKPGCLNAVYATAAASRQQIQDGFGLVGVFHQEMDLNKVHIKLLDNAAPKAPRAKRHG